MTKQINVLYKQISDLESKNQSHLDSIRWLNNKIETIEALKLILTENLEAKESQIASLREEINELKENLEKWSEKHKEIESKLDEKTRQMNLLEEEFNEKNQANENTSREAIRNEIRNE